MDTSTCEPEITLHCYLLSSQLIWHVDVQNIVAVNFEVIALICESFKKVIDVSIQRSQWLVQIA